MSANTEKFEKYDPHNYSGYEEFRGRAKYLQAHKAWSYRERTPEGPWNRELTPDGPWDREEERISEKRHRAYVRQLAQTAAAAKTKTKTPKSDDAAGTYLKEKNNSFQSDVSSVCVNYVL
jgi:hypothetical protein